MTCYGPQLHDSDGRAAAQRIHPFLAWSAFVDAPTDGRLPSPAAVAFAIESKILIRAASGILLLDSLRLSSGCSALTFTFTQWCNPFYPQSRWFGARGIGTNLAQPQLSPGVAIDLVRSGIPLLFCPVHGLFNGFKGDEC